MGGSVSRPEIILDQEEGQHELRPLPAGSLLQGRVVVKLSKPIRASSSPENNSKPEASSSSSPPALELRLYGKEKVCMNRTKSQVVQHGATAAATTKRTAILTRTPKHAERALLDVRMQWPQFPLLSEDGQFIPEGTYVFPFQVQLPTSLPSSIYYPTDDQRHRSKMRFRIQYKLSATLMRSGGSRMSSSKAEHLSSTEPHYLWIVAAAPQPPLPVTPCILEPIAREIKTGGGGIFRSNPPTGELFWCGAAVENCHLSKPGGGSDAPPAASANIHVHVACRNDSTVPVRHVQIQVLERCTWGTTAAAQQSQQLHEVDPTTGRARIRTTLQQTDERVLLTVHQDQLPGLAAKEKPGVLQSVWNTLWGGGGGGGQSASHSAHQRQLLQQVFDDIVTDRSLIPDIQLPPNVVVRESYAGQLVQIQHLVRIEFPTAGGGSHKLPILELPLQISGNALPLDGPTSLGRSGAGTAYRIPTESATTGLEQGKPPSKAATASHETKGGATATAMAMTPHPNDIPTADAVEITNDDDHAVLATDVVLVLGGDAMLRQQARRSNSSNRQRGLMELVPLAPPPSLPTLLCEMNASIDDFALISQKLLGGPWVLFFQQLNPDEFGSILAAVHNPLDQSRVALLLAPHLHQGQGMQCVDAAAAVRNALPQHRAILAQRLLPVCTDALLNQEQVRAVLTDWERTVSTSQVVKAQVSSY